MRYMLLIHQGTTPTPYSPDAWAQLSENERNAIADDYRALNETPGVTPGEQLQPPEAATTVRVEDGRTLVTDGPFVAVKEALGGWLMYEADDLDAAMALASRIPAARLGGAVEVRPIAEWCDPRAGLPRRVGARPRGADRLPRRLRARRGGRSGGVCDRRRALAARRHAGDPARLARDDRPQPRDRPLRRDQTLAAKTQLLERPEAVDDTLDETTIPDERLELLFTCCHPALALDAQVALTLRTLGGLSTDQIARAFLVPERDDGQAAGPRQAQYPGGRIPFRSPRSTCCPTASPLCSPSST